jgi:hypothetical protein
MGEPVPQPLLKERDTGILIIGADINPYSCPSARQPVSQLAG